MRSSREAPPVVLGKQVERKHDFRMRTKPGDLFFRRGSVAIENHPVQRERIPSVGAAWPRVLCNIRGDVVLRSGGRDDRADIRDGDPELLEHHRGEAFDIVLTELTAGQGCAQLVDRAWEKNNACKFSAR